LLLGKTGWKLSLHKKQAQSSDGLEDTSKETRTQNRFLLVVTSSETIHYPNQVSKEFFKYSKQLI